MTSTVWCDPTPTWVIAIAISLVLLPRGRWISSPSSSAPPPTRRFDEVRRAKPSWHGRRPQRRPSTRERGSHVRGTRDWFLFSFYFFLFSFFFPVLIIVATNQRRATAPDGRGTLQRPCLRRSFLLSVHPILVILLYDFTGYLIHLLIIIIQKKIRWIM